MAASNRITKVAIVGAGGNSGRFMTEALLGTGKHTVTAITRADSQSDLPEGVIIKKIDYAKPETLLEALRGQDALVITLAGMISEDIQTQLINAASEVGVGWILPNEWGPDNVDEGLIKDLPVFASKEATRKSFSKLDKSSYICVSTGFWYEWSLAMPIAFGVDFDKRSVTFFDNGETKISLSTWPQVGRAVTALLSLPIKPESSNETCLENFKNKVVYVKSFTVSQKDMLESVLRVTGTKEGDWTVTNEPSKERFASGAKDLQEGNGLGFVKMLYTRIFYQDGLGDFEHRKGTINGLLNLPEEDIDEATKKAIERSKTFRLEL